MKACIYYQIFVHQFAHNLEISVAIKEVAAILLSLQKSWKRKERKGIELYESNHTWQNEVV